MKSKIRFEKSNGIVYVWFKKCLVYYFMPEFELVKPVLLKGANRIHWGIRIRHKRSGFQSNTIWFS